MYKDLEELNLKKFLPMSRVALNRTITSRIDLEEPSNIKEICYHIAPVLSLTISNGVRKVIRVLRR